MKKYLQNAIKLPLINLNFVMLGGHIQKVNDNWVYPRECHLIYELIFVVKGKEHIKWDDTEVTLNQNEFVVLCPGMYHTVLSAGNLTYFCFHFDVNEPQFEERLIVAPHLVFRKDNKITKKIKPLLEDMINHISPNEKYSFVDKMDLQLDLTAFLSKLFTSIRDTPQTDNLYTMQYAKLIKTNIKSEIDKCINKNINKRSNNEQPESLKIVNIICQKLNISPSYACKIFKNYFKITPNDYCTQLKIQNAKRLLLKPQLNINQISFILGYTSASNFSRGFKKATHCSPKKYRLISVNKTFDKQLYKENFENLYNYIKNDPQKNWQLY